MYHPYQPAFFSDCVCAKFKSTARNRFPVKGEKCTAYKIASGKQFIINMLIYTAARSQKLHYHSIFSIYPSLTTPFHFIIKSARNVWALLLFAFVSRSFSHSIYRANACTDAAVSAFFDADAEFSFTANYNSTKGTFHITGTAADTFGAINLICHRTLPFS